MEDPDKGNKPGASPANEDINDPSNPCVSYLLII